MCCSCDVVGTCIACIFLVLFYMQVHFGDMVVFNTRNVDTERIPNTSNISIRGTEFRGQNYSLIVFNCGQIVLNSVSVVCVHVGGCVHACMHV